MYKRRRLVQDSRCQVLTRRALGMDHAIAVTTLGSEVYVLNGGFDSDEQDADTIFVFSLADFSFRRKFGGRGTGPGKFFCARSLAASSRELFVCEEENERIQIVDRNGSCLRIWESHALQVVPLMSVVVCEPTVCICDIDTLRAFSMDGTFAFEIQPLTPFTDPQVCLLDEELFLAYRRTIEVYDRHDGTLLRLYKTRVTQEMPMRWSLLALLHLGLETGMQEMPSDAKFANSGDALHACAARPLVFAVCRSTLIVFEVAERGSWSFIQNYSWPA